MSLPLYNITLSSVYSSQHRKDLEAYVIDRQPQGPLVSFTELQDNSRTACDPCGAGLNSSGRTIPNRYAIKLPDSVKRAYPSVHKTDYVDSYTLPGFLSWLMENGYNTVDMKHVVPVENYGFWIEFSESSGDEFRGVRALPQSQPRSLSVTSTQSRSATPNAARVRAVRVGRPGSRR